LWPLSDVNDTGYWAQVPWEWRGTPDGSRETLRVRTQLHPFEDVSSVASDGDYSPNFLTRFDTDGRDAILAAHQDFSGVVSLASPARAGETVHVYMTGLGALRQFVATGSPTPLPGVALMTPVVCDGVTGGVTPVPLKVPSALFAAGMIGIYQVDVTLPSTVPNGLMALRCGDGSRVTVNSLATRP
jgi:uncharacterized protein (TIGR03437 family)